MKVGITCTNQGLLSKKFSRESISSRILGAQSNGKPGSVGDMEIVISAEGRRLASQTTPVEKLKAGPDSAFMQS